MKDKIRNLDDAERDGEAQQGRANELKEQAEQHRERVCGLKETIADLRTQHAELGSEAIEMAIAETERAKQGTESEIEKIRTERDELLDRNREISEQVESAHEKRKQASMKIASVRTGATGEVAGELQAAADAIEQDLNRLGFADALLREARSRLEQIDL